jgi:hypothetical protein
MAPREGQTGRLKDGSPVIYMDGAPRRMNEAGMADMGGGFFKSPNGQTYRLGPKGGFSQVAGPTREQVDKYSGKTTAINESMGSLDMVDRKLRETKTIGPFGWFTNPNDLSELQGLTKDLLARLKESPYNLGVLNGPDLPLMEEIVGNPSKLKDAAFRKAYQAKLRNVASKLGDTYRNDSRSFETTGGEPTALPNLFQSKDSTFTPQEWGRDGRVPAAKAPTRRGDAPRTGAPAGRPPLDAIFK